MIPIVILFIRSLWCLLRASALVPALASGFAAQTPGLSAGTNLQLWVDGSLIERMENVSLRLHSPEKREVVFRFDAPWEGGMSAYVTVLEYEGKYRMYYRAGGETTQEVTAMAVSTDGIHWARPSLGQYEFGGARSNNIVFRGRRKAYWESHNFTPFVDRNPQVPSTERFKALGLGRHVRADGEDVKALVALASVDGVQWQRLQEAAVITEGSFDSQNVAFWDGSRREYVCYFRDGRPDRNGRKVRSVKRTTSKDFRNWTEPIWLEFGEAPLEHFYVNTIAPYFRSPGWYLGFPMRFVPERKTIGAERRAADGLSDAVFIASRDGLHFQRLFLEAFIRPGPDPLNWGNSHGNNTPAWGLLQTSATEISMYWAEHYGEVPQMRRGVLRLDGFVSVRADYAGGTFITQPLVFTANDLVVNYSSSAVGAVSIAVQDRNGNPLSGYGFEQCGEIYGDEIARTVRWNNRNLGSLRGRTLKLCFRLKDADVYAFRFAD